jgi:hypothetical protein
MFAAMSDLDSHIAAFKSALYAGGFSTYWARPEKETEKAAQVEGEVGRFEGRREDSSATDELSYHHPIPQVSPSSVQNPGSSSLDQARPALPD